MTAPSLSGDRNFSLLWVAQTVSQTGSQVTTLALPLVAIVMLKASTLEVGLLSIATTVGYLLTSLPAGVLIDGMSKRRMMVWCDLVSLTAIVSVPLAAAAHLLTLMQLYVVASAVGVSSTFFVISYASYLPELIPAELLVEGNGKLSVGQSAAQFAGPGLGALLIGLVGTATALTADAGSYLISALCLLGIRSEEKASTTDSRPDRTPRLRKTLRGLSYVYADPILRSGVAWNGTANFFVIIVETLGPVYLVRSAHVTPALVGVLLGLGAGGGIAGGLISPRLAGWIGSARLTWLSATVPTLPGLLIPLGGQGWNGALFAVGWISWSFGSTLCGVGLVSYQQHTTPPELRGQVAAARRWVNWGTLPLGGLAAGVLGTTIGVHLMLWIAVGGGCAAGLWLVGSPLRGLRDLPFAVLETSAA